MPIKKRQTNHHPQIQRNKNVLSHISSFHVSNLFGLTPTGNIKQFNKFFNDLSRDTLCLSDLEQKNIHTFNDSSEYTQLDQAYDRIITHKEEITDPNMQLCPDFLKQCPTTNKIDVYEMKAKMKDKNKIPSISFNIEQFLKYKISLADKWNSDFMIICYLYTLEKDIMNIKEPRNIAKEIQPTDIVFIPSDYIIQYNPNLKNTLKRLNLDIDSIKNDGQNMLNNLKTELEKQKYKNNSAYFSISAKDLSDIITNKTTHKVYQQQIEIPTETVKWTDAQGTNRRLITNNKQIQLSCIENGKTLNNFWNGITNTIPEIETNGGLYNGLSHYLEQHSYNTQNVRLKYTLSHFS
ncbi:MAG: hypothetical protein K0B07_01435 [DPANN group archaeon]|nr:hypothetical protein [DPANN group archaeon]